MKLSRRARIWVKVLLILLAIRLLLGIVLIYFVTYRFNDVIQLIVDKESKTRFLFHAKDADISVWNRTVALKQTTLISRDSGNKSNRYYLTMPAMYFSLHSILDFVLNRHITVDSLMFESPQLEIYANDTDIIGNKSFQFSQITDILKTLGQHLNVRAFNIHKGSFVLHKSNWRQPFSCSNIDFNIKNFSRVAGEHNDLLSSEDVDLLILDQHWVLPALGQTLQFKKLHFSGVNQFFELDSAKFHSASNPGKTGFEFSAERMYFNSRRLQDSYESDQLFLDTMICYRPLVRIESDKESKDSNRFSSIQELDYVFRTLQIGYIEVNNGQLFVNQQNNLRNTYLTQKANLKIFNLQINRNDTVAINVDSVQLALNDLKFQSKDSLYEMSIRLFTIHNNDLILSGANYGPSANNKLTQRLNFRTSLLHIRHVNISDLLQKKLTGTYAELSTPEITFSNDNKILKNLPSSRRRSGNFYKSLHELHDLINVDSFQISKGNLHYRIISAGTDLYMHRLDATILLNKFLISDSLIDIKRSLPVLRVEEIRVESPKAKLVLSQYLFNGISRSNYLDQVELSLENNTSVIARNLYWEIMDWDLFENKRILQFDNLHVGELAINSQGNFADKPATHSNLPVINIGRLDIDSLHFASYQSTNDSLSFVLRDLYLDQIHTDKRYFVWGNMHAWLRNLRNNRRGSTLSVNEAFISNETKIEVKSTRFRTNSPYSQIDISAPSTSVSLKLHSSDFSNLRPDSIQINDPIINVTHILSGRENNPRETTPSLFSTPSLRIQNGRFQISTADRDGIFISGQVNMHVENIKASFSGKQIFEYSAANLTVNDLFLNKKNLQVQVPAIEVKLNNGKILIQDKLVLTTSVLAGWSGSSLNIEGRDSSFLKVLDISGSFSDNGLSTKSPLQVEGLLSHASIHSGVIKYGGPNWNFEANEFTWTPPKKQIELIDYILRPKYDKQEYFNRKKWQADYIELSGKAAKIEISKFQLKPPDTLVRIRKILLDRVMLVTSRDKRMEFQHGIIKPMPTTLIEGIRFPIAVDTVDICNSKVVVKEIALKTGQEGVVEINNLKARIYGISNDHDAKMLNVHASADIFGSHIQGFRYSERYHDSLSKFNMSYQVYPIILTYLNPVTVPLTSVRVKAGRSDTLFTNWSGNKYAAIGTMNFYYQGLSVKVLDPKDQRNSNLKFFLINALANTFILRSKNNQPSIAYFERDREKFIFNYWVKTTLSGIVSSVGFVKDSKYLKEYKDNLENFSLPPYKWKQ